MNEKPYTGTGTDFYVASTEVAETVNLAIELKRPLLVEGEPGSGKTMLAYSIAKEKDLDTPIKISVKSTSQARDLLYRFDALRRLQDAQDPANQLAQHQYPYISLGPLGLAIYRREPCIVLIDEIDKADIDFPNDLLDVMDTFTFQIADLPAEEEVMCIDKKGFGCEVRAQTDVWPIVVVTSNREKQLPEALLRRCLYVYLDFPKSVEVLASIVRKNIKLSTNELNDKLLEAATRVFIKMREIALSGDAQKPPTTSELIDWVKILHWKEKIDLVGREETPFPPYWETLFKTKPDLDTYSRLAKANNDGEL